MPDIIHEFPIAAPLARVYAAVSTPAGLDQWWTLRSDGVPGFNALYSLDFGPGYEWRAHVRECEKDQCFELELVEAMPDWIGTRVRFELTAIDDEHTQVLFRHIGWPALSEHFAVSSFCWAMYLRIMRRALEFGEVVPFDARLEV
ncbi:MAG: SRPBCC domain-containing protein [Gemmatimonadaceae bacterium]